MIVDSSALIAILLREPEAESYATALARHSVRISAATLVEVRIVVEAKAGPTARRRLDALLRLVGAEIVAVDEEQATIAADAYRDFGRGSGHAASLNFGDCFSYALAASTGEPLLYKGDDFGHTDIRTAVE